MVRFTAAEPPQAFTCDSAEASSDFLRLYGETARVTGADNPDSEPTAPLLAQFRLKGEGAITGWWWEETTNQSPPQAWGAQLPNSILIDNTLYSMDEGMNYLTNTPQEPNEPT